MPAVLSGVNAQKPGPVPNILRRKSISTCQMLTAHRTNTYPSAMEQMQPESGERPAGGGAMSKVVNVKDRVDSALSQLESMVEERLRAETARSEELAKRLTKLEQQHEELRNVAVEVESRLERAMEYIRSLLAADQK